jgi:hypothetical protein
VQISPVSRSKYRRLEDNRKTASRQWPERLLASADARGICRVPLTPTEAGLDVDAPGIPPWRAAERKKEAADSESHAYTTLP